MKLDNVFKNTVYAGLIAIFCAILWGSAFPVLKISYDLLDLNPTDVYEKIFFAGLRFFIAALLIFAITKLIIKTPLKLEPKNIKPLLLLGLLQTAIMYFFFYNGLSYTSGIKSSILISSNNFFIIIIAHFIYKNDKISYHKIIGLITGFLGILVINFNQLPLDLNFNFYGEGFLILSALSGSIGNLYGKKISDDLHPFKMTAWQMMFGALILLSVGYFGMERTLHFTPLSISLLLYAAFLSATAFSLWFMLLKYNKAGKITIYRFMIPISGTILSITFLPSERFSINVLFGLILVSFGIIQINKKTAT